MILSNARTIQKEYGFTIVELLIVIVVIAILAAIIITAYQGVQNRAKLSQYQTDVSAIVKKSEVYASLSSNNSTYPLTTAGTDAVTVTSQTATGTSLTSTYSANNESKLPSNVTIFAVTAGSPTNTQAQNGISNSTRSYFVKYCATGKGMYIYYPDPTDNPANTAKTMTAGICP